MKVASAAPSSGGIGGFFGNLFGSKRENQSGDAGGTPPAQSPQAKPKPAPATAKPAQTAATDSKTAKVAVANPQPSPPRQEARAEPEAKSTSTANRGGTDRARRRLRQSLRRLALSQMSEDRCQRTEF
jgi:monoamine oxidase